jgi:hypothetical protein
MSSCIEVVHSQESCIYQGSLETKTAILAAFCGLRKWLQIFDMYDVRDGHRHMAMDLPGSTYLWGT